MDENSRRNREAAERAERYLKAIPRHLLGPAGRILVSNPAPSSKPEATEPPPPARHRGPAVRTPLAVATEVARAGAFGLISEPVREPAWLPVVVGPGLGLGNA